MCGLRIRIFLYLPGAQYCRVNILFVVFGMMGLSEQKTAFVAICVVFLCSCGVYSFQDSSIPAEVKTIHVSNFTNRAAIVNPRLANELTNGFKSRIQQQTRLNLTENGLADYDIDAYISQYNVSTAGIVGNQASQNQLNVSVHIVFTNNIEHKLPEIHSFETDVSLSKQFGAQLTLQQAEQQLLSDIVTELVNLMFNKLFSNW